MFATGTLINTGAIIIGGFLGNSFGHRLQERHQEALMLASGISVLFIGIAGAMEGMLTID